MEVWAGISQNQLLIYVEKVFIRRRSMQLLYLNFVVKWILAMFLVCCHIGELPGRAAHQSCWTGQGSTGRVCESCWFPQGLGQHRETGDLFFFLLSTWDLIKWQCCYLFLLKSSASLATIGCFEVDAIYEAFSVWLTQMTSFWANKRLWFGLDRFKACWTAERP